MTWLQELPLTIRLLPVGLLLLCVLGVFVFMAKRPVDGEIIVGEALSENRAGIAIGLILIAVALLPSLAVFALALTVAVGALFAVRSQAVLERIEFARL